MSRTITTITPTLLVNRAVLAEQREEEFLYRWAEAQGSSANYWLKRAEEAGAKKQQFLDRAAKLAAVLVS